MRSFCAVLVLCVFIVLVKTQSSTVSLSCRWSPGLHNYTDALSKTILFFEGQRSGKLPADQRIRWRRDSGLSDDASSTVDLVGVYYDAGDNVKFGYPMAFTTTMLSWTCLEFGRFMGAELSNAKAAIRWATDYLLKATAYPGTIFVQKVGDPNNDHKCWERAEDMDTLRTAYKIDSHNPGSDVAAEIAAVLAAASLVFRGTDPSSSRKLIRASIMVFDFADKHRGSYSVSLKFAVCPFYCLSSGFEDELLWGAAWLYKATKNAKYLNYIRANGHSFGVHESDIIFGWFNKHAGPRVLLSKGFLVGKVKFLEDYKDHADDYICSIMPGTLASGSKYTPGGLLYTFPEVNMQYVTSASFLLMTYAKYLSSSKQVMSCGGMTVTPRRLREIAKGQVDYILGSNPLEMSYMVGYGSDYPQRIHHRGSSLPSLVLHPESIGCSEGFKFLNSDTPNPNILVGAVVGGPDANDQFPVDRHDYQHLRTYKIYQCSTAWSSPLFGPLYYSLLVLP